VRAMARVAVACDLHVDRKPRQPLRWLLPIFGLSNSPFLGLGLAAAGAWLTFVAWRALRAPASRVFAKPSTHQLLRRDGHGRGDPGRCAGPLNCMISQQGGLLGHG